jgi:acetyl esterase
MLDEFDSDEPYCRELALAIGCDVVVVRYRLAPEHPAPAALFDCYSAFLAASAG